MVVFCLVQATHGLVQNVWSLNQKYVANLYMSLSFLLDDLELLLRQDNFVASRYLHEPLWQEKLLDILQ